MEKMKRTSPRNKAFGFTLVELVIVIAVIAILAAVLIPTFIGVIDSANNSADVQLAANLNSTVAAEVQLNSNVAASAQNIRFKAKDYGYEAENLATKKSDNVIVYNKNNGRFEVLDVSDIKPEQLVPAYYAEEVIDGYIIVSTKGNDLAEALYDLSNLPSETAAASIANISAIQPAMANSGIMPIASTASEAITKHVQNALNRIDNSEIRGLVAGIVQSTLYVNADGNMYFIDVKEDGTATATQIEEVPTYDMSKMESWDLPIRSRVQFSENVDKFDVEPFMKPRTALSVIIPENVTIEYDKTIVDSEDLPTFSGNVGDVVPAEKVIDVSKTKEIAGDEIINDITEAYQNATSIYYNANQIYTSDFKNDFATTLQVADKIYELKQETVRLIVNDNVNITSAVTIPHYVDVQIPFALGDSVAKAIMTYNMGNMLGAKELGSAYPANDSDNLNKSGKDQMYYLCGEGPGGGHDIMLYNYVLGLTELPENFDKEKSIEIFGASRNLSTQVADYSLTLAPGAILNIEGNVTVGAVIGYPNAGGYQGHTSGKYGKINNNGKINVNQGGVLDVFGFIEGDGEVVANSGGLVFEPFIVTDYLDTMNTLFLYPFCGFPLGGTQPVAENTQFNSPFMRYAVENIRTKFILNYGSSLYGRANLIVFGGFLYCRANAPLITSDNYIYDPYNDAYKPLTEFEQDKSWTDNEDETYSKTLNGTKYTAVKNGAFALTDGSSIESTYDGSQTITIEESKGESYEISELCNKNSLVGDIGVVNLKLKGDISTHGIKMDLLGGTVTISNYPLDFSNMAIPVDTAWCTLPVPYNFNFVVEGNLTIGDGNKYALMPGVNFTVANGGTVTIKENAGLYALETYKDSEFFRSWGNFLIGNVDNMKMKEEEGYYYDSQLDTIQKPEGQYGLGDLLLLIMGSMKTFAPKYYPSATLLAANGFSTSATLTVNGTIIVENGGDLGGKIIAGKNAKINLASGAGMGKILNLGGPYDSKGGFLAMLEGRKLEYENGGTSMSVPGMVGLPFEYLSTVYVNCYLSIVNEAYKEIDFTESVDYTNSPQIMTVAFGDVQKLTFESAIEFIQAIQEKETLKITTGARTAAKEITIDSSAISAASKDHVVDDTVAYFKFESDTLTLTDNKQAE